MSSTEPKAYDIMTKLDVDYVLVIFGGLIGYSGDDINKFLWMVRIAEGEHPQDIREADYFTYKLSYYRFGDVRVSEFLNFDCKFKFKQTKLQINVIFCFTYLQIGGYTGFDRTRNTVIGNKNIELTYLEEAYTSEHWLVRIYRVKKPWEFNRPRIARSARKIKTKAALTKKVSTTQTIITIP
jgi:dolichyl-diphosphooligosaccharide--protein glycosyltransferase